MAKDDRQRSGRRAQSRNYNKQLSASVNSASPRLALLLLLLLLLLGARSQQPFHCGR